MENQYSPQRPISARSSGQKRPPQRPSQQRPPQPPQNRKPKKKKGLGYRRRRNAILILLALVVLIVFVCVRCSNCQSIPKESGVIQANAPTDTVHT